MLTLLWTLLLLGAASAQIQVVQNVQSDVCHLQIQTWKDTLEKYKEMCMSLVDKNRDRFQQSMSQDLLKIALDLKERDQNLAQKLTQNQNELKAFFELKTISNFPLELTNLKIQDLEKLEDKSGVIQEVILLLIQALKEQKEALNISNKGLAEMNVRVEQSLAASSEIKTLLGKSEERMTQKLVKEIQQLKAQDLEKVANDTKASQVEITESPKNHECSPEEINEEVKTCIAQAETGLGSEVKSLAQKLGEKFKALDEKVSRKCQIWKEKVAGLELKKLDTGVYYFGKPPLPWKDAVSFCELRGMHLAMIESEKEKSVLQANKSNLWVGASDIGYEYSKYFWQSGRPVDYYWITNRGQYGYEMQTCLLLTTSLSVTLCTTTADYVCEVSSEFEHCV